MAHPGRTPPELPCVGAVSSYQNQQLTADVTLRPCMAYTLDIVTNPATPQPTNQPIVPLYRTPLTTCWVRVRAAGTAGPGPWTEPTCVVAR